jgi:hypothetical protein
MRMAAATSIAEKRTQSFSADELRRSANFVGAVLFWRELQLLSIPDAHTNLRAQDLLRDLGRRRYADCDGYACSSIEAKCFEYCGLEPKGVRPPSVCEDQC